MQKKLIALAVAGLASSGAFAQSNVEIYGTVDLSLITMTGTYSGQVADTVGTVAGTTNGVYNGIGKSGHSFNGNAVGTTTPLIEYGSRAELASGKGNIMESFIGFRGTEDLGGGLKAGFALESSIAGNGASEIAMGSNNAPTANIIGDKQATVSLTHSGMGRVMLGRQGVVSIGYIGHFDPFPKGPGAIENMLINPITSTTANNSIRLDTKLMDVNLTFQYAMSENSDRLVNNYGVGSVTNLAAYYGSGPLAVTVGHAVARDYANGFATAVGANAALTAGLTAGYTAAGLGGFAAGAATIAQAAIAQSYMARSISLNHLAGTYDFGVAKLYAQYLTMTSTKTSTDTAGATYGTSGVPITSAGVTNIMTAIGQQSWVGREAPMINASSYLLGISVPFGSHKLLGSFVSTNDKRTFNQDGRSMTIGYEYALSKRTKFYARGAKVYNTNGSTFGVVVGGNTNVALNGIAAQPNNRTTAYMGGLIHNF